MKIKNYVVILLINLFCFSLFAQRGQSRGNKPGRSFSKPGQIQRMQQRPSMKMQAPTQRFQPRTIDKPDLPTISRSTTQRFTGKPFDRGPRAIDIKPKQIDLPKKTPSVKIDPRIVTPSFKGIKKPTKVQISPRAIGRPGADLPSRRGRDKTEKVRGKKTDFKDFSRVKKDIDTKFVRRRISPTRQSQLKKAITDIKRTDKLSPTKLAHLRGRKAHKFAKFRTPRRLALQKQFLHKHIYKGKQWLWWWKHKPYYFLIYFPLFFKTIYGYYPPIYYDFYTIYGYAPIDQCFEECARECTRECLNTTDLSLENCQDQCTEVCSNNCGY